MNEAKNYVVGITLWFISNFTEQFSQLDVIYIYDDENISIFIKI